MMKQHLPIRTSPVRLSRPGVGRWAVCLLTLLATVLSSADAYAQRGDRGNQKQPEVWKKMDVPEAPPVSADQALSTFRIAPGFELQLVAAEPLVEDPVAITWDAAGRIWAVEMRGYMPNVDGTGEDVRNGQIVVLEDTNGDGKMDQRTVFLDELQMPRAIAIVNGGVLVSEPPNLWFCRDTNGDLKCDEKAAVLTNYGRQGPVEHTENGLMWGLDNWLYNAKSSRRFQFIDGKIIEQQTARRGQWGITQDNQGRLYHNSNSSYLSGDVVPAEYHLRNPNYSAGGVSTNVASDQSVYSIRVNPGINRGYQNKMLRDDGRLARTTATCGPVIYRGDQFPAKYVGDAFIPEPSGNVVSYFDMSINDRGQMRGQHTLFDDKQWGKREFLASTDERFRPVNAYTGPDGCLYIVDMYRGILQHKVYVTTFLRKQILERGLDKPLGMGRIYRVVYVGGEAVNGDGAAIPPRPLHAAQLDRLPTAKLVDILSHPNGWHRDTAQRLLIDRADQAAVSSLRAVAASGAQDGFGGFSDDAAQATALGRLHALWTLDGLGALDDVTIASALTDADMDVQIAALRLSERLLNRPAVTPAEIQAQTELVTAVTAKLEDERYPVLRQLAFTLSEAQAPAVGEALRTLLLAHAGDRSIRDAVLSGLHGRELEFLQRLLVEGAWAEAGKGRDEVIRDLAGCVVRERNAYRVQRLLGLIADEAKPTAWRRKAMLDGMIAAAFPRGRQPKPVHFEEQPLAMAALLSHDDKTVHERARKLTKFVTWGAEAAPPPPPTPLTASEQKLFTMGQELYMKTCGACHGADALGEEGKAPPLLDSPWLLGDEDRLVRIVLQGLTGPIEVHGRMYNMDMPPLKGFTDEQYAAILTYTRRAWEHPADPITPDTITRIRKATANRETAWTVKELKQIK